MYSLDSLVNPPVLGALWGLYPLDQEGGTAPLISAARMGHSLKLYRNLGGTYVRPIHHGA